MSILPRLSALGLGFLLAVPALAQDRTSVSVGELTVSYGDVGQGDPIVLVHGGGLTSRMWGAFADAAVAAGYRVLTPDTRNHGGTDNPSGTFGYDLLAEDLAGFITALGLQEPVVMGYSDGGIIVETFLQAHPDMASAAVIGGASHRIAADEHYMNGMMAFYGFNGRGELPDAALDAIVTNMPKFAERLQGLHATEAEPDRWRSLHKLTWPVWTSERIFDLAGFAAVDAPVLVFLGQHDEFFLPEDALALARAFKKGEVAVMPGGTHTVFRDRPEIFAAVVLDFLTRAKAE
ncbi:MAG: alpha/beta hydrolase [Tabrizicola sp.]|nr:alpha/beta hydrolase [Tabrizicola sp.]